ncbi:MAG TPA: DUF4062 domain-containing protein [Thermoleophilaceae bacterium]|nr:DUF4062 domain-containing protein [Thermoleophilaceae bacterium]
MEHGQWQDLILERSRSAPPLSDDAFRVWMRSRPIFVSSTMDDELNPLRESVRQALDAWGADPVMWEEITPRDERPAEAYLAGVDRSDMLIALVGRRHGVSDESGYSPTQKEVGRAASRGIPRLLFEADVPSSDRTGPLNDWVASLRTQISSARFRDGAELAQQLIARLREVAASQERTWIKLGSLVFPGTVTRTSSSGTAQITAHGVIADPLVRREFAELSASPYRAGDRLTWGLWSESVNVRTVEVRTPTMSRDEVTVVCETGRGGHSIMGGLMFGTVSTGGRSYGSAEQAGIWADEFVFGRPRDRNLPDFVAGLFRSSGGPTLPEVLSVTASQGWQAEGLTRLYILERLAASGGYFERLDVGPATAAGVRVHARFVAGAGQEAAELQGLVPYRPG